MSDADIQELDVIRGIASAEGYDPDEVVPQDLMESVAKGTEEVEAELSPEPTPVEEAPEPEVKEEEPQEPEEKEAGVQDINDPEYAFKLRRSKRFMNAHNERYGKQEDPPPQPAQPPAQAPQQQPQAQSPSQEIPFEIPGEAPDLKTDPEGYLKWQTQRLDFQEKVFQAMLLERAHLQNLAAQQQQQQVELEQQSSWVHEVGESEKEWAAAHTGYWDRYEEVKGALREMYIEQGFAPGGVGRRVTQDIQGMVKEAYEEGIHPCRRIENLHSRLVGNTASAPTPAPTTRQRNSRGQFAVARQAEADGEGVSLSGAGGQESPILSPDRIRAGDVNRRQVAETLSKIGTERMMDLMIKSELG